MRGWLESLPFEPTAGQRKALEEIDADLVSGRPMQRLLMGEVGSGKTVVALYAMLRVAEAGMQAALMAPTETLAEQHFATIQQPDRRRPVRRRGGDAPRPAGRTADRLDAGARARGGARAPAHGELRLLVGTHALIQEAVEFDRLALAVVDEQHRFGVRQRAALDGKARGELCAAPAAPDRDADPAHAVADPVRRPRHHRAARAAAGRRPVKTWVVPEEKRDGAYEFIRERLREGRQCFVVCPLVEESEALQARAATVEGERLARGEFARLRGRR